MSLQPNDIIPLGVGNGSITLLANENGLRFIPPNSVVGGRGNSDYWDVSVPVTTASAVALRLLGVSVRDIKSQMSH